MQRFGANSLCVRLAFQGFQKRKFMSKEKKSASSLAKRIKKITGNLYYISETDAEILPFKGEKAEAANKETLLAQICADRDAPVEERNFEDFFSPLTEIQDWFGAEEKKSARKFLELKDLLQKELKDMKVFKVGNIELDVYVVGLDSENILSGIKTQAVET